MTRRDTEKKLRDTEKKLRDKEKKLRDKKEKKLREEARNNLLRTLSPQMISLSKSDRGGLIDSNINPTNHLPL